MNGIEVSQLKIYGRISKPIAIHSANINKASHIYRKHFRKESQLFPSSWLEYTVIVFDVILQMYSIVGGMFLFLLVCLASFSRMS